MSANNYILVKWVKNNMSECTHEGKYKGVGVHFITIGMNFITVTVLYCENCGQVFNKTENLDFMKDSTLPPATPEVMPGKH